MSFPIISGTFVSNGSPVYISMPAAIDWMWVYNYTAAATHGGVINLNAKFYWQLGMAAGTGIVEANLDNVANDPMSINVLAAPNGFYAIDSSVQTPGIIIATGTAVSAANPSVASVATTPTVGQIVRLYNVVNAPQLAGLDFIVTAVNAGVSFTIGNLSFAGNTAGTTFGYAVIPFQSEFYPRERVVTYMANSGTNGIAAGVTRIWTSVTHGYQVGQKIELQLPGGTAIWGNYARLNGVVATIIAIGTAAAGNQPNTTNNFDINVDSTGFSADGWTANFSVGGVANTGAYPDSVYAGYVAIAIPVGMDMAFAIANNPPIPPLTTAPNTLTDSLRNVAIVGMKLSGGTTAGLSGGPAGASGDRMYWVAGSSFDALVTPTIIV